MRSFVETIFPPWKWMPRILKHPIALFAAFCALRLSGWLLDWLRHWAWRRISRDLSAVLGDWFHLSVRRHPQV